MSRKGQFPLFIIPNIICQQGLTALHIAAARGDYLICKLLIDAGAQIDKMAPTGGTPLHLAVINKRLDICQLLLLHNANRELEIEGMNALSIASLIEDEKIQALLR